jgi:AmmeMemoRadiSam system protein A
MENLTKDDKNFLLDFARKSMKSYLLDKKVLEIPKVPGNLQEKRGVFVTLQENHELRGCIGYIEPIYSIIQAVRDNAIAAATKDVRFLPVSLDEVDKLKIEISILTKPESTMFAEIKPGIDGVIIENEGNQATYLPQIWGNFKLPKDFFASLCLKADLPSDAYLDKKTKLYTYKAEVFSE